MRRITDQAGNVVSRHDYTPFGQEIPAGTGARTTLWGATDKVSQKFTGKERDAESGLDYFGARYFRSTMGRFMSPDSLGGDLTNAQSSNRYAYVVNNPLRYTDPTGMYVCNDSAKCDSEADKAFENGLGMGLDGKLRAEENVTIRAGLSGSGLDAVVGHEGSHVAVAQDFVSTMTMGGNFYVSKNLSKDQTEFKAYMVSNSIMNSQGDKASYGQGCDGGPCILGFGVGQRQAGNTINQLLANPTNGYGVTPKAPGALLYPTLTVPTVPK